LDREAIARLQRGDAGGFDLAYESHHRRVYGFLVRLSGRSDVADDLFQETWLRFARHAARLRPDSDLRSWLLTVARNVFVSHVRHLNAGVVTSSSTDDGSRASEIGQPEAPPLRHDGSDQALLLSELERALLTLTVEDRELLLLVAVEGLSQNQVASMLGIDAAAVRQRVTRARARLATQLSGEDSR
jgi:RNA polymerase sigma factor (sigma-70 family)